MSAKVILCWRILAVGAHVGGGAGSLTLEKMNRGVNLATAIPGVQGASRGPCHTPELAGPLVSSTLHTQWGGPQWTSAGGQHGWWSSGKALSQPRGHGPGPHRPVRVPPTGPHRDWTLRSQPGHRTGDQRSAPEAPGGKGVPTGPVASSWAEKVDEAAQMPPTPPSAAYSLPSSLPKSLPHQELRQWNKQEHTHMHMHMHPHTHCHNHTHASHAWFWSI